VHTIKQNKDIWNSEYTIFRIFIYKRENSAILQRTKKAQWQNHWAVQALTN